MQGTQLSTTYKGCEQKRQESIPNEQSQAGKLVEEYDDVFNGLGNLGKHHIVIDKTVPATANPPRKVPFGL